MLEGLHPNRPTHVMRLHTDEHAARTITDLLGELFDPAETAIAAFEAEGGGGWLLEAYFSDPPDESEIRDLVRPLVGAQADEAVFEAIEPKDWVRASLEGLKPVRAGRILVHGVHDEAAVRANDIAIRIEAALAFGTGHHGTTRGCLLALEAELKRRRPRRILDVGTGTGILAFAAAKALKSQVIAGDIDPVAIAVARDNARLNGVAPHLRFYVAPGVRHALAARPRGFDLIFANVLAKPLKALAPSLAGLLAPAGTLVLSGLLAGDVTGVLSAYAAQGLRLSSRLDLEGWATLILRAGEAAPRPGRGRSLP
jgi:ribosomal protein L11 methyltransferase